MPTEETTTLDPKVLAAMPIADHFGALVDAAADANGITPSAVVDMHAGDGPGLGLRVKRYTWEEFDEERAQADARPGRNVLVLRFAGVRGHQAQRVIIKTREEPASPPVELPTPMPPPVTYGPDATVTLLMAMMQQQAESNRAQLQQQQETNSLLLARLLDKADTPREKSIMEQMLELDELLERRADRRDRGNDSNIMESFGPLMSALADGMKQAAAKEAAKKPPEGQPAPTAKPPAKALPPASPANDAGQLLATIGAVLTAGAAKIDPNPDAYAEIVLDLIEAAGFEPAQVLDSLTAGVVIEQYPQLPPAFVEAVDASMREQITDEPSDETEEPPAPAAETPAKKPAKGRSKKHAAD